MSALFDYVSFVLFFPFLPVSFFVLPHVCPEMASLFYIGLGGSGSIVFMHPLIANDAQCLVNERDSSQYSRYAAMHWMTLPFNSVHG